MDSMDNFRERIEALKQQMKVMGAHTHMVERRLRWWRGIACGVGLLALVNLPLPSGTAQEKAGQSLAQRLAALEYKLQYVTGGEDEVVITGANLRIVNGLGSTETKNGLGNLIVGYNEPRQGDPNCPPMDRLSFSCTDTRTGSHSVVVGSELNFSMFGGLVVGFRNEISGPFASVSGGSENIASGPMASVSGGEDNTASSFRASVSGGEGNVASNEETSVSGGTFNTASGAESSVSGGTFNTASGFRASVSGGEGNVASGDRASVSGGEGNVASGDRASVSGGEGNVASGDHASVSGGSNRSARGTENWAAGALFSDN